MSDARARTRVLLLVTTSAGGAGVQALQLAAGISRARFDLTVALGPGYPLDAEFDALGHPFERVALRRGLAPLSNLRALVQVARLLRRERIEVLCTSCSMAGFVGRLAAVLARTPVRIHILQVYASRPYQPRARRAFFRWIERALDRVTTRYVAVSHAGLRYGVDTGLFDARKAEVVFNAAELEGPTAAEGGAVRRAFDLPDDAPVIGTLGRYEPQKGLVHFLHAAARVLAAHPRARFLIVGDGPQRAELERLASSLGIAHAVRFTGWRDDVPALYGAMDVFCLASLWEAFGIVLAEAMLAGLPVVATRVDGIPEVVDDGETGYLVPPADPDALAARLDELLRDPARRAAFGAAGRDRATALFSVDRMVAAYERVLADAAANAGS